MLIRIWKAAFLNLYAGVTVLGGALTVAGLAIVRPGLMARYARKDFAAWRARHAANDNDR
jgi:hypothetical protein